METFLRIFTDFVSAIDTESRSHLEYEAKEDIYIDNKGGRGERT